MKAIKWIVYLSILYFATPLDAQIPAYTSGGSKVWLFSDGTWKYADTIASQFSQPLEWPFTPQGLEIITHTGFSLVYSEVHEQALWVAYELSSEECNGSIDRSDKFKIDPKVKTGTADDGDYAKSGYDRGHLAPAADMAWSETAMAASFYYSNMSPQLPGFNRGIWKRLEEQVRNWAKQYQALYIVTGPVLTSPLPSIGKNAVTIPPYFYKILLDYRSSDIKALAFLMPHASSSESLKNYAVSIDSVEKITQINFFYQLPDGLEEKLESEICLACWEWGKQ